ncbi:uncharacterized protein BDV14DRAFT_153663 [Aspergillus stella-maris]|uniref:uncharacterized protein n=1 Tax=Aspergillus stella-maris TaxID=1810926 RepID=UPI003CCE2BF8
MICTSMIVVFLVTIRCNDAQACASFENFAPVSSPVLPSRHVPHYLQILLTRSYSPFQQQIEHHCLTRHNSRSRQGQHPRPWGYQRGPVIGQETEQKYVPTLHCRQERRISVRPMTICSVIK